MGDHEQLQSVRDILLNICIMYFIGWTFTFLYIAYGEFCPNLECIINLIYLIIPTSAVDVIIEISYGLSAGYIASETGIKIDFSL